MKTANDRLAEARSRVDATRAALADAEEALRLTDEVECLRCEAEKARRETARAFDIWLAERPGLCGWEKGLSIESARLAFLVGDGQEFDRKQAELEAALGAARWRLRRLKK